MSKKIVFIFVPEIALVKAVAWQTPITGVMAIAVERDEQFKPDPLVAVNVPGGRVLVDAGDVEELLVEAVGNNLNNSSARNRQQLFRQFNGACEQYGLRVSAHNRAHAEKLKAAKINPLDELQKIADPKATGKGTKKTTTAGEKAAVADGGAATDDTGGEPAGGVDTGATA